MRILIVHNDYGRYSGEEAVVDRMIADMRGAGNEVETLRCSSQTSRDRLSGKIRGFFAGMYSLRGRSMMRRALRDFRPDVVNIHNLYPFISPSVLPLCRKAGIPVVMTVHNYRLICPTGLFMRNGMPCEQCLDKGNEWSCIRHNCEKSMFRSVGYALRNMVARKTRAYLDNVSKYCCLTDFQRDKLIAAGFVAEKIAVIPNYVEIPEHDEATNVGEYVGYVGRLSEEKGYDMLVEVARRHPEIAFHFAGTPREGVDLSNLPENVTICGQLNKEQLAQFYEQSRFIVIPSRCYEGFPVALIEAAAHRRCCIVPNHGAFPDIIKNNERERCGVLFEPCDVEELGKAVERLWNDAEYCYELGNKARQNCETRYTRRAITEAWNDILSTTTNTQ
jgi:glycosyltransferase involved in cell wall biosynthesis